MNLASLAGIGAGFVVHNSDAVFFVAGVPGLNGSPGKLALLTVFIGERHLTDGANACDDGFARSHVDGAEDPEFEIRSRIFHKYGAI